MDLLPWTIKKPGEKAARRLETGLIVKGTGEGQKVKGKMWERTLKGRLEMRRQAMLNMPAMIQEWKQVSFVVIMGVTSICADCVRRKDMDVVGRSGRVGKRRDRRSSTWVWEHVWRVGSASIHEWRFGIRPSCMVESSELCVYNLYDTRIADLIKQGLSKCYLDKVMWGILAGAAVYATPNSTISS